MNNNQKYNVIGLMSGTSLDGLDIAYCIFELINNKWSVELKDSSTIPYSETWKSRLKNCMNISQDDLDLLSTELGKYWGKEAAQFIDSKKLTFDFISSHGHTVFHQPEKEITVQIGCADEISNACKATVVSDFRIKDVQLGGQGAPLVPIGDKLLFSEYEYCLNLGGISNISYDNEHGERKAFDISPCNLVLNYYANSLDLEYDNEGNLGRKGGVNFQLLEQLNKVEYYSIYQPKSLGKEYVDGVFIPLLESFEITLEDKLATFYEHISYQISSILVKGKCLITGGGAYNSYLIELIEKKAETEIILPENQLISFKEALIFAFLGVLRSRNETNILKSYTGAREDSSSGIITNF